MTSLLAKDHDLVLHNESDALDVMSAGLPAAIFQPSDLHPDFFELSNQIAGNVLQKFVNYHFRVAIIVADNHAYGVRVTELIRDHQRHPTVRFFPTIDDAYEWLT